MPLQAEVIRKSIVPSPSMSPIPTASNPNVSPGIRHVNVLRRPPSRPEKRYARPAETACPEYRALTLGLATLVWALARVTDNGSSSGEVNSRSRAPVPVAFAITDSATMIDFAGPKSTATARRRGRLDTWSIKAKDGGRSGEVQQ